MYNPWVSVILPAYNAERFIKESVDSVFDQTYRPIEIIIVDDGSTDRTSEIIKNYQTSLNNKTNRNNPDEIELIYIHQENSGPSKARNTGIKASKGEYLAFLDSDDIWMRDKIDRQMQLFKRDPEIDIIFCNVKVAKWSEGRMREFTMFENHNLNKRFFKHDYKVVNPLEKLLKINFMLTPSVIANRSCFKEGLFFNEKRRYAEDWELWLKMSLCFTFSYVDDVLVHVKDEGDGLCSHSMDMLLSKIDVMENFLKENIQTIRSFIPKQSLSHYRKETYKWAGYYFMMHKDYKLARDLYKKSLKESFDIKTILYYFRSFYAVL